MAKKKTVKRPAKRPTSSRGLAKPAKKAVKRPAKVRVKARPARKPAKKRPAAKGDDLGRARVAGTAELDAQFLKDYEARQVFTFLGVKTLKELEELSAQQIIERLTAPMVQTVTRIRKALALQNRCLKGDERFAVEMKRELQSALGR